MDYGRMKANSYIRAEMRNAKIPQWMIAERLGVSENTLRRWMRSELPEDKQNTILGVIWEISAEDAKQNGGDAVETIGTTTETAE